MKPFPEAMREPAIRRYFPSFVIAVLLPDTRYVCWSIFIATVRASAAFWVVTKGFRMDSRTVERRALSRSSTCSLVILYI